MTDPQSAEAVRASDRAHGPVAAVEAERCDLMTAWARKLADDLSTMLPEGMRFEWK